MTLDFDIKRFLQSVTDISIGYQNITFVKPEELEKCQILRSIDVYNSSLDAEQIKNWLQEWIVIAWDNLGDPICVDVSLPNRCVLTVTPIGTGEPSIIADSLANFELIIRYLTSLSKNRENPVDLMKNPIPSNEREAILKRIKQENAASEISFWEIFLDNET